MNVDDFVGREAEARTLLANAQRGHSTLLVAPAGMGKTALIEFIMPLLAADGKLIETSRVGPGFASFLRDLFTGLHAYMLIPQQTDSVTDDWKQWGKQFSTNDAKAAELCRLVGESGNIIITIDDASGVTPTSRPWLIKLVESAAVIAAVDASALSKKGSKRFWKLFDELSLGPLNKQHSADLLTKLIDKYSVVADDLEIYTRSVLELAQGSPFELTRLVKHHSSESLVRARELRQGTSRFVARDVKQVALAPLVFVLGAFVMAGRYIARVQNDMDGYVLSALGLGVLIVFGPLIRKSLKPRSKE
ncbi:MAG: hypothetical protein AAF708_07700 [Deinococcota bacterium]